MYKRRSHPIKNKSKKVSLLWLIIILVLLLSLYFIFSNKLNGNLIELSRKENSYRLRILELEKEEAEIKDHIILAQTEGFIENSARTKYGYLRPGELRFMIVNPEALYDNEIPNVELIETREAN